MCNGNIVDKLIDRLLDMQHELSFTKEKLSVAETKLSEYSALSTDVEYYKEMYYKECNCHSKTSRLLNEVSQKYAEAQLKLREFTKNDPDTRDKARSYMKNGGFGRALNGERVSVIKEIRDLTMWGLKESKDFVDEYLNPAPIPTCVPSDNLQTNIKKELDKQYPSDNEAASVTYHYPPGGLTPSDNQSTYNLRGKEQ